VAGQKALIGAVAALILSPMAHALEVERLDVELRDDRYVVEFVGQLEAAPEAVHAVLTDYAEYPTLDPRIQESRVLERDQENQVRLYTRMRGCLGSLMCRTMQRVEEVQELPDELLATAILDQSDVRFGVTRSQWQAKDNGTQVTYRLEIMPKFWIPPLFGRRLMISALRSGTLELFTNVEKEAKERNSTVASP
jgi:ribosome-associated toxin RatA of RatAB toxin-antitoxin module